MDMPTGKFISDVIKYFKEVEVEVQNKEHALPNQKTILLLSKNTEQKVIWLLYLLANGAPPQTKKKTANKDITIHSASIKALSQVFVKATAPALQVSRELKQRIKKEILEYLNKPFNWLDEQQSHRDLNQAQNCINIIHIAQQVGDEWNELIEFINNTMKHEYSVQRTGFMLMYQSIQLGFEIERTIHVETLFNAQYASHIPFCKTITDLMGNDESFFGFVVKSMASLTSKGPELGDMLENFLYYFSYIQCHIKRDRLFLLFKDDIFDIIVNMLQFGLLVCPLSCIRAVIPNFVSEQLDTNSYYNQLYIVKGLGKLIQFSGDENISISVYLSRLMKHIYSVLEVDFVSDEIDSRQVNSSSCLLRRNREKYSNEEMVDYIQQTLLLLHEIVKVVPWQQIYPYAWCLAIHLVKFRNFHESFAIIPYLLSSISNDPKYFDSLSDNRFDYFGGVFGIFHIVMLDKRFSEIPSFILVTRSLHHLLQAVAPAVNLDVERVFEGFKQSYALQYRQFLALLLDHQYSNQDEDEDEEEEEDQEMTIDEPERNDDDHNIQSLELFAANCGIMITSFIDFDKEDIQDWTKNIIFIGRFDSVVSVFGGSIQFAIKQYLQIPNVGELVDAGAFKIENIINLLDIIKLTSSTTMIMTNDLKMAIETIIEFVERYLSFVPLIYNQEEEKNKTRQQINVILYNTMSKKWFKGNKIN
ncbi:hypothetical protein DFA_01565 [Cavenderia fasciculata]|uniref:Uncharacterized protein n=1 Tax=Cavenderia fasciculata TaxID=261658 RepID=F4PTF7_CACFS|nr:uncharacterized protein DFA_01565 [Cavenderia fasciculata]EGG21679.1 hypothetical protein DFA_01565 [Cavenderia fasciculata]|eukprot:XP_004359529.1 hypothetical protein DFA_01565 [Cavenderia fasciculata]